MMIMIRINIFKINKNIWILIQMMNKKIKKIFNNDNNDIYMYIYLSNILKILFKLN